MALIEAGVLLSPWGVLENRVIEVDAPHDMYFDVVMTPGFSDAHAHPQVIDVGSEPGRRWSHSYEWLKGRRLRVDEASLRMNLALSSNLAKATLLKSLFDGVTMIALTGSFEANFMAVRELGLTPRVQFTPTVMDRAGWSTPEKVFRHYVENISEWDGYYRVGFFIHSLGMASRSSIVFSYRMSKNSGLPLALHLSEGVDEVDELVRLLGDARGIVAVHCIEKPEKCRRYGLKIVHCPLSNLYLFGRTIRGLEYFDALGSDWPLVTGTLRETYRMAVKVHGETVGLLEKATLGGYRVFNVPWNGDLAAFTGKVGDVISGRARPDYVFVRKRPVIVEREYRGLTLRDVEKFAREQIRVALEKHGR